MENGKILQLKIVIMGTRPPVWRTILIENTATYADLHDAIQHSFGWTDSHLHEFRSRNTTIGRHHKELDEPENRADFDSKKTMLLQFLEKPGDKIDYNYDFGDDWQHKIRLEKIIPHKKGQKYPVCIGGAMACPPDDCGGIYGFEDFKKAVSDKKHPEHKEMLEWAGGYFDPEEFSVEDANARLGHKRKKGGGRPGWGWVFTGKAKTQKKGKLQ